MTETRFHAERVNPQVTDDIAEALNALLERDDVAGVVDWDVVDARSAGNQNVIVEYEVAR